MFCPNCGKNNADQAKFCSGCGQSMSAPPVPPVQSATDQATAVQGIPQVQVRNYLVHSIIAIFFFFPLAIVALVNAIKVDNLLAAGNIEQAKLASKRAKLFVNLSILIPVLAVVLVVGVFVIRSSNEGKGQVSYAASVLKTYETLQQAYIAEKSQVGTFGMISFHAPQNSEYFNYYDRSVITDCGAAIAVSKVAIGKCPKGSVWAVGVPNSMRETVRLVSSAECAALSPATFQEVGELNVRSCMNENDMGSGDGGWVPEGGW